MNTTESFPFIYISDCLSEEKPFPWLDKTFPPFSRFNKNQTQHHLTMKMKQKWNTKLRIHACKNQDPKRKSFRQLRSESYAERNWLKGRKARVSKSKLWSTTFPQTKTLITFLRSLQWISYSKVCRVPYKPQNKFGTQAKIFRFSRFLTWETQNW